MADMNLENALGRDELIANSKKFKKIFFYRMCGTGMGACACLMKEEGLEVEGADSAYFPPMSDYLRSTGIPCHDLADVDEKFLQRF